MDDSLPPPGPFTLTSTVTNPLSIASRATSSAAWDAANGVLFLEPLKPKVPALFQQIALPFLSDKVIMVLLKLALIKAIPSGETFTFFFF